MAWFSSNSTTLNGTSLGGGLADLMNYNEIQPGDVPSYATCKNIYTLHPIGKKMVDAPISIAQSQAREIVIPGGPEDRIRDRFLDAWKALDGDKKIAAVARVSRIYGIGSIAVVVDGQVAGDALDFPRLYDKTVSLNVLDPLNTSGSIGVLNQDPNSVTFQATSQLVVSGTRYHPSRTCVLLNESPIYIDYTTSAFSYTGRSVYQRALYPLKSFVQTMRTDDLITRKAGVIVAKLKQVGSYADNIISAVVGQKRALAKEAITDDVLSVGSEDVVETLDMKNAEGPFALARKNIIENIATAADMPAIILNSETYAEGFGEGTEDAKKVAGYVDGVRRELQPAYDFLDKIAMYRAWTPDFYKDVQRDFPEEYGGVDFEVAFNAWRNSFRATWPSLITEPPSETVKIADVKFRAAVAAAEILLPAVDPDNKVVVLQWLADLFNEAKELFPVSLALDPDALEAFVQEQAEATRQLQEAGRQAAEDGGEPKPPRPFADSAMRAYEGAVARLQDRRKA